MKEFLVCGRIGLLFWGTRQSINLKQVQIICAAIIIHNFIRRHAEIDIDFSRFENRNIIIDTVYDRYHIEVILDQSPILNVISSVEMDCVWDSIWNQIIRKKISILIICQMLLFCITNYFFSLYLFFFGYFVFVCYCLTNLFSKLLSMLCNLFQNLYIMDCNLHKNNIIWKLKPTSIIIHLKSILISNLLTTLYVKINFIIFVF